MTPIIERLAREAGIPQVASGQYFLTGNAKIEAFAKAVARECINIADGYEARYIQQAIRERFGL